MGLAPIPMSKMYDTAFEVGVVLMKAGSSDVRICKSIAGSHSPWTAEALDYRLEIDNLGVYCSNVHDVKVKVLQIGASVRVDPDPITLSEFLDLLHEHQFERAEHAMTHGAH